MPSVGNLAFLPSGGNARREFYADGAGGCAGELAGGERPVGPPGDNRAAGAAATVAQSSLAQTIVLNTLSSLTNRENRFAAPRFSDDYFT